MKRLLSAISALAFAASLGTSAFAADKMTKGNSMGHSMMSGVKCKKGEKWVKGYTKKDGTKVKGYCRKG